MARLHHVEKARKDYPESGINKGDSYYWWQFAFSAKSKSLTRPTRSQLTRSEFYGTVYDIEDREMPANIDDFESFISEIVDELTQLAEEQEEKHENMPESLYDSPTGELLDERAEAVRQWASDLENVDVEFDEETVDVEGLHSDDAKAQIESAKEERISEIQEAISDCVYYE